jgi:lysozyme family protein
MTAANYQACLDKTLCYEGGYSDDPRDAGNWTGCAYNAGQLKGTMKGISACAYPTLDIQHLTDAQIQQIYRTDYWNKVCGDDLPAGVDLCTFDSAVNSGPGKGVEWLQMAMGMPADEIDGAMGPITLDAVAAIDDPHVIIDEMCDERLAFLKCLAAWPTYGQGWSNRVEDVRASAHGMAVTPTPVLSIVTITITITAPVGVEVNVVQT